MREIFKLYARAAYVGPKLTNLFVARMLSLFTGSDLAHCFQLDERTLETILQVQPPQSTQLFEKALEGLTQLLNSNSDAAYLIELCC